MVKSKELKLMRKRLEKADRIEDPLKLIGDGKSATSRFFSGYDDDDAASISPQPQQPPPQLLSLHYKSAADLLAADSAGISSGSTVSLLQQCLNLFERNMGDLYRNSSWGLDMKKKAEEFQHKKARFLLVTASAVSADDDDDDDELAAFVHFRCCYDDDDNPEFAVLYVYEIQVSDAHRRRGLGRHLMAVVEAMAAALDLTKVMLTVFQTNKAALQFYQKALEYEIDANSPSRHGDDHAEYEILSKVVRAPPPHR